MKTIYIAILVLSLILDTYYIISRLYLINYYKKVKNTKYKEVTNDKFYEKITYKRCEKWIKVTLQNMLIELGCWLMSYLFLFKKTSFTIVVNSHIVTLGNIFFIILSIPFMMMFSLMVYSSINGFVKSFSTVKEFDNYLAENKRKREEWNRKWEEKHNNEPVGNTD